MSAVGARGFFSLLEQLHPVTAGDILVTITINTDIVVGAYICLKSDGRSLMSDHVLHALPLLASKLSGLFTALIYHGYTADLSS